MRLFPLILAAALSLPSCEALSALIGRDSVARAGNHKLYRADLEKRIPDGLTGEDSLAFAMQYINSWAADMLFLDMAESQLSKEQKDVSDELEEYRVSLLKYRYEQSYINERLDTSVSAAEIKEYYDGHTDKFKLEVPIVKARFLLIDKDSPSLGVIRRKMSSEDVDDLLAADSLSYSAALKYRDCSDTWMDVITLSREFGTDYVTMLSRMQQSFIEMPDEYGNMRIAYVADIRREGRTAPLEYCAGQIKDIILSNRKHMLMSNLERDLLKDARTKQKFVIY